MGFSEKSEPVVEKEPVITPVNADIDKSLLGKGPELVPAAQNTTTLGLRRGAGIVNTSAQPKKHIVNVRDFSKMDSKVYDYLVHCDTCGWQGRYKHKNIADNAAQNHTDLHLNATR